MQSLFVTMFNKIKSIFVIVLIALIGMQSCRSSQFKEHKPRTLKKGKPIPCPIKDC